MVGCQCTEHLRHPMPVTPCVIQLYFRKYDKFTSTCTYILKDAKHRVILIYLYLVMEDESKQERCAMAITSLHQP